MDASMGGIDSSSQLVRLGKGELRGAKIWEFSNGKYWLPISLKINSHMDYFEKWVSEVLESVVCQRVIEDKNLLQKTFSHGFSTNFFTQVSLLKPNIK